MNHTKKIFVSDFRLCTPLLLGLRSARNNLRVEVRDSWVVRSVDAKHVLHSTCSRFICPSPDTNLPYVPLFTVGITYLLEPGLKQYGTRSKMDCNDQE